MTVYLDKSKAVTKENEEAIKAGKAIANLILNPVLLMLLWNWLIPGLFGLATINYFKALGLYIMSRILFDKHE